MGLNLLIITSTCLRKIDERYAVIDLHTGLETDCSIRAPNIEQPRTTMTRFRTFIGWGRHTRANR